MDNVNISTESAVKPLEQYFEKIALKNAFKSKNIYTLQELRQTEVVSMTAEQPKLMPATSLIKIRINQQNMVRSYSMYIDIGACNSLDFPHWCSDRALQGFKVTDDDISYCLFCCANILGISLIANHCQSQKIF